MATHAHTTRRSLFALAGALPVAAALSAPSARAAAVNTTEHAFVELIAGMHPNGRAAAIHALAAGMRPEWLNMVILSGWRDETADHRPDLVFTPPDGRASLFFNPNGRSN